MNPSLRADGDQIRSPRLRPKKSTRIECHNGMGLGPNLAVNVEDLSQTEIRLVVKTPVKLGQEIQVNLESILHRKPIRIIAQVTWVVPTPDGAYSIGARFVRKLPFTDLQMLGNA